MHKTRILLFGFLTFMGCSESAETPGEICEAGEPGCVSNDNTSAPVNSGLGTGSDGMNDGDDLSGGKDTEGGTDGDTNEGNDVEIDIAECAPGDSFCDGETPVACVDGLFIEGEPCPEGSFCESGSCNTQGDECIPGESYGCFSETAQQICEDTGASYKPVPCPEGKFCLEGDCGDQLCIPGSLTCISINEPGLCNEAGDSYVGQGKCEDGGACVEGICKSGCAGLVKYGTSYIGCEYWSVDLDQYDDPTGDPKNAAYGVVISNPGANTATITFEMGTGDEFTPSEPTVPAGESKTFILPTLNDDGTGISNKSIRILGDRPITVHQFNPIDNLSKVYSNDASLLLPANVLGTEYYVLTWPTSPVGAIDIIPEGTELGECCTDADCPNNEVCCETPLIKITSCDDSCSFFQVPSTCEEGSEGGGGFGDLDNQHGYMTIVASWPGSTSVTVTVKAPILGGPGVQPMEPGTSQTFDLQQFEVLTLQAAPPDNVSIFELTGTPLDLSGSHIISDNPIVVFSGHEEAVVGTPPDTPGAGQNTDNCCAEHLEEQLFPVKTWGSELFCIKTHPRSTPTEVDHWRIVAAEEGTVITTDPVIEGLHGVTIGAGEWVEAPTTESFQVIATKPIMAAQYTVGQQLTSSLIGDPSQILVVPASQFRSDYLIMTPAGYEENYLTIVRPAGLQISFDGEVIPDTNFATVANGDWEYGYITVTEGAHQIDADEPFGVSAYGWSAAVSYGFPGGLNLDK